MRLIAASIRNPIAVAVTVALICLFGALSLAKLPLQLFPDIDRPNISIFTGWRASSPEEAEAQLLEPQEQVLQGLVGVEEIEGNANSGGSFINLTFSIGTDMKAALVDVIGRMNRIRPLPADADRPVIQIGGGGNDSNDSLSWFFVQLLPGHGGTDRELSALHRGRDQAAHRIGARRRFGQRQRGSAGRCAHHRRSREGRGARRRHSGHRRSRDGSGRRFRRPDRRSAVVSTRCVSPAATNPKISASSCSPGAMVGRSSSAMSRQIELKPPEQQFFVYQNGNPAIGLQVLRAPRRERARHARTGQESRR